jgi:hypothetical protein
MPTQLSSLARLGKRRRNGVLVHIQADVDDMLFHDPTLRRSIQPDPRDPAYC